MDFANWWYENKLIGYTHGKKLIDIFISKKETLESIADIQGYGEKQLDYNTGGPGVLENLYTEDLLKSAFAGYQILDSCSYEQAIDEGDGHAGMSALVGFVAQKL
jgi:hypothetical protein